MENKGLIKYQGGLIKHVSNAISVTNKLLALRQCELIPYRKGDKWGFCTNDRKIIIDCKYQEVHFYSENLAGVKMNDTWGFIDENGNGIISCKYEQVYAFCEGYALIKRRRRMGVYR